MRLDSFSCACCRIRKMKVIIAALAASASQLTILETFRKWVERLSSSALFISRHMCSMSAMSAFGRRRRNERSGAIRGQTEKTGRKCVREGANKRKGRILG
jgi:hypothetical protein